MAVPAYVIYRDIPAGEAFDPTSPLLFFPPKGSDELFDALRLAFPLAKTHSERMRDAIIQYLLEERHEEQASSLQQSPADTIDMSVGWSSLSSTTAISQPTASSVFPSPETLNLNTPASASYANSPASQLVRHASIGTSCEPSPPSLDQLTGVFSLSTSPQPKQRIRRKMTEAEKIEYRKRRIVKACDKCAKRKRKCPHNQTEMETLTSTTSKASSRVTKSTSPKSAKTNSPPAAPNELALDPNLFSIQDVDFTTFDPTTFVPLEDFDMFDEPFPELSMNDFALTGSGNLFTPELSPMQHDWQYSQIESFGQLDPVDQQWLGVDEMGDIRRPHASPAGLPNMGNPLRRQQQPPRFEHAAMETIPNMISSSESLFSLASGSSQDGSDSSGGNGNRLLWEHLRTGQLEKPSPTHTAHVHDAECGRLSCLGDHLPTLSQTVLQLSGAGKALKRFSAPLSRRVPSRSVTITMDMVVDAVRNQRTHLRLNDQRSLDGLHAGIPTGLHQRPYIDQKSLSGSKASSCSNLRVTIPASWYDADIRESGLQLTAASRRARAPTAPELTSSSLSVPYGSNSVALKRRPQPVILSSASSQRALDPSLRRRYADLSLGEGIPGERNPSYELYAARKRISSVKNTFTGANMNAGLPVGGDLSVAGPGARLAQLQTTSYTLASSTNGGAYLRREEANKVVSHLQVIQVGDIVKPLKSTSNRGVSGESRRAVSLLTETDGAVARTERPSSLGLVASPMYTGSSVDNSSPTPSATATATAIDSLPSISGRHVLLRAQSSKTSGSPQTFRLCDTKKFKDHHGRPAFEIAQAAATGLLEPGSLLLASLFILLILLTNLQTGHLVAPSALALAMLSPLYSAPETSAKAVQCTTKNSSWLHRRTASGLSPSGKPGLSLQGAASPISPEPSRA